MLKDNMNISHLMVYVHLVKETKVKMKSRDADRANSFGGCFSKGWLYIKEKPRFKMRFSNQDP